MATIHTLVKKKEIVLFTDNTEKTRTNKFDLEIIEVDNLPERSKDTNPKRVSTKNTTAHNPSYPNKQSSPLLNRGYEGNGYKRK